VKEKKKGYIPLLVLTVLFTLMTISTFIPQASASKACLLGYRAHCTFTPISSVTCLAISGILCVLRKRLLTR
jgi:hypothetical protein